MRRVSLSIFVLGLVFLIAPIRTASAEDARIAQLSATSANQSGQSSNTTAINNPRATNLAPAKPTAPQSRISSHTWLG